MGVAQEDDVFARAVGDAGRVDFDVVAVGFVDALEAVGFVDGQDGAVAFFELVARGVDGAAGVVVFDLGAVEVDEVYVQGFQGPVRAVARDVF